MKNLNAHKFCFSANDPVKLKELQTYLTKLKLTHVTYNLNAFFINATAQSATTKLIKGLNHPGKVFALSAAELSTVCTDQTLQKILS